MRSDLNAKERKGFRKGTQRNSEVGRVTENELSHLVVGCAMRVHSALGPGLLESAYEACLQFELTKSGLKVEAQKPLPLVYEVGEARMRLSR